MQSDALALAILPILAVAMIGGLRSFPLTMIGGLLIGVLESELTYAFSQWPASVSWSPGVVRTLPLLLVAVVLTVSGESLPARGHFLDRLPSIGPGRPQAAPTIAASAVVLVAVWAVLDPAWIDAMVTMASAATILLSIVVVTDMPDRSP